MIFRPRIGYVPASVCFDPVTATLLIVGTTLSVGSAYSNYKQSIKQAEAITAQGKLEAEAKAKQVKKLASSQRSSFLSSGISLTGDDDQLPNVVTSGTYSEGKADVNQIISNANQSAENTIGQARSQLISTIGTSALGIAGAGLFSGVSASSSLGGQASAFSSGNSLALSSSAGSATSTGVNSVNSVSKVLFTP